MSIQKNKRLRSAGIGLLLVLAPLTAVAATSIDTSEPETAIVDPLAAEEHAAAMGETLEVTEDNCGRAFVLIADHSTSPAKMLSIPKGSNIILKPVMRRFAWFCAEKPAGQVGESTKEWTTCASGTDRVRIVRDATGREIRWHCMDD